MSEAKDSSRPRLQPRSVPEVVADPEDLGIVAIVVFLDFVRFPVFSYDFDADVCRNKVAHQLKVRGFAVTEVKQILQSQHLHLEYEARWRDLETAVAEGIKSCSRNLPLDNSVPGKVLLRQYQQLLNYGVRARAAISMLKCGTELERILFPEEDGSETVRVYIQQCIAAKDSDLKRSPMRLMTPEQLGQWMRDRYGKKFTEEMEKQFVENGINGKFYLETAPDDKQDLESDFFTEVFKKVPTTAAMAKLLATDRKYWYRFGILFQYAHLFLREAFDYHPGLPEYRWLAYPGHAGW